MKPQPSNGANEFTLKCVIVGDLKANKNELLYNYKNEENPSFENYIPWVIDNYCKQIKIKQKTVSLTMWDTSGQEEYNETRKLSYLGSDIIFIVFNILDKNSFDNALNKWYPEIKESLEKYKKMNTIIFLGNSQKKENEKNYDEIFKEKKLLYLEVQDFSSDILSKAITDSIKIYIEKKEEMEGMEEKNKKKCILI